MADVFLSYARPDASTAERAASALTGCGWSVWFDRELPPHRAYSDVIATELECASAVLVLWSKASVESDWVRSEANRAREVGKLVQARLDCARLPMPFDQIQCADLVHWRGASGHAGWSQVCKSIQSLADQSDAIGHRGAPTRASRASRRTVLIGAGAGAITVAAGALYFRRVLDDDYPNPQARLLIQKGVDALQDSDSFDTEDSSPRIQAIRLLTDAVKAAPNSSTAWGALAWAYAVRKKVAPLPERLGLDSRCRAAAATALALDRHEERALGALRLIEPVYRNWLKAEQGDREALKENPTGPALIFNLSEMLASVGRWRDALGVANRLDRKHFLLPGADRMIMVYRWTSGDLQGADDALANASQLWPDHPQIWRQRVAYLMYSGRSTEALEVLHRESERPQQIALEYVQVARATAEALAGHQTSNGAVEVNLKYLRTTPSAALQIAQACAALAQPQTALVILEGYYFAKGEWAKLAPAGGDYDRATSPLFQPPMKSLWQDEQFNGLLERVGLNSYWRESRTVPDFRNSSGQA